MVRVKHRYLLLDILYPDPTSWPPSTTAPKNATRNAQSQLRIHSPTSDALTPSLLAKMVREAVAEIFGDWGVGRLGGVTAGGVSVKYLSPATSTAIIRCPRASFRLVWTALTYMSRVPEYGDSNRSRRSDVPLTRPCVFRVIRISGTMRKAEEEAIRRARREIVRLRGAEEVGVLGGLVGGLEYEEGSGVVEGVMENDEEDVDMGSDGED
ncbi:Rpp14/Pop5 family-domain-containing protein [Aspergillus pseudonomiae]|nr:Rpp14/Pop5 family-domain-containing protein [Aspergillus pseudonomiae]